MDNFFDAQFYEATMGSVFTCHLPRSGSDVPKSSQERFGSGAKSDASSSPPSKGDNDSNSWFPNYVVHARQPAESMHSVTKFSYMPKPLLGWTSDEQLSLIVASKTVSSKRLIMSKNPKWTKEMAHHKFIQLISEQIPGKSAQECARCLKHLDASRVAYFGENQPQPGKRDQSVLFQF